MSRLMAGGVAGAMALVAGCAMNSQTGRMEMAPGVRHTFRSVFDSPNPCSNNGRNIGLVVGLLVGAAIGYKEHSKDGALIGAAIGAGAGGLIGHAIDARRCKLYQLAQENHLRLASAQITARNLEQAGSAGTQSNAAIGLDVQLQNRDDEFEPGTATLTPIAQVYFSEIAEQYTTQALNGTSEHKVLIVAHSDEGLDSKTAARQTEQRARAVAEVFREAGVSSRDIYYQGAGDTLPIASNGTAAGRAENRRVQIVDVPTEQDLKQYLRLRQPNDTYFVDKQESVEPAAPVSKPQPHVKTRTISHVAPAHRVAKLHKVRRRPVDYDFGGEPLAQANAQPIDLGRPVIHSTFSLISTAYADTPLHVGSCMSDRPRVATAVRNLETGDELPVRDYMPGFYGAPWLGGFHGNLVVVDKAFVPRDSGSPLPSPKLMIYHEYHGDSQAKPSFAADVPVNVYRGDKATLYRLFVDGPIKCIDFVKLNQPGNADARLYYRHHGAVFMASGAFALRN